MIAEPIHAKEVEELQQDELVHIPAFSHVPSYLGVEPTLGFLL